MDSHLQFPMGSPHLGTAKHKIYTLLVQTVRQPSFGIIGSVCLGTYLHSNVYVPVYHYPQTDSLHTHTILGHATLSN